MRQALLRISSRLLHLPAVARYAITAALAFSVLAYKYTLAEALSGIDYIFVAPLAAVCAVFLHTGAFATILTAVITYVVLIDPAWSLTGKEPGSTIGFVAFLACGFIITAVTDLLHESLAETERLSEERRHIAAEINHRTKNNLQIIAALLRTEARDIDPGENYINVLEAAARRLSIVGKVHDMLFRDETRSVVLSDVFLRDLCNALHTTFLRRGPITLKVDVASERISMSQATTIGLLVNELVTNAIKHAFPDGTPGDILVEFKCEGRTCRLTVSDNGRGKPIGREPGFGSRMILTLVDQLNGVLTEHTDGGTTASVEFALSAR